MTAYRVWQTDSSDDFAHSEPSVIVEAADWLQAVETWLGKTEGVTFKLINIRKRLRHYLGVRDGAQAQHF
jgi:hypothetical protein